MVDETGGHTACCVYLTSSNAAEEGSLLKDSRHEELGERQRRLLPKNSHSDLLRRLSYVCPTNDPLLGLSMVAIWLVLVSLEKAPYRL